MNQNNVNQKSNNNSNSINTIKTSIKSFINTYNFFPKINEKLKCMDLIKIKKIININDFKIGRTKLKTDNTQEDLILQNIYNTNFCYENDLISKQFSFYESSSFFKFILISNIYKIFVTNLPTTGTVLDFYTLITLICPDFPKILIKKFSKFYYLIKNKEKEEDKNIDLISMTVNFFDYFVYFGIYYYYQDFFIELEKFFNNTNNVADIKQIFQFVKTGSYIFPKEFLIEVIISYSKGKILEEFNLSTANLLEDVEEMIEKYIIDNNYSVTYSLFAITILRNYNLIQYFFKISSNSINNIESLIDIENDL